MGHLVSMYFSTRLREYRAVPPNDIKISQLCLVNLLFYVWKIANMASSQLPESEKISVVQFASLSCLDTNGSYSPMVRTTLLSGRVLLGESLSCCLTISSYFGTVATSPFGTMCTTLKPPALS